MARLGALLVLTGIMGSGCTLFYEDGWSDDWGPVATPPPGYYGESNIQINDAYLEGDLGDVTGINGNIYQTTGFSAVDYASVEVHSRADDGGAAMTRLSFDGGGLDHPDLVPGAVLTFDGGGWADPGSLHVSTIGCSGNSPGAWDYDSPGDNVQIVVFEGSQPGFIRIDFTANFTHRSRSQTVYGSFEAEQVASGG